MKTYIVDSFTDTPFKGNPAGVCLLESSVSDEMMLNIAQGLNLSETAFILAEEGSSVLSIRYFSPKMEIPLCGHATLASAPSQMSSHMVPHSPFISTSTRPVPPCWFLTPSTRRTEST